MAEPTSQEHCTPKIRRFLGKALEDLQMVGCHRGAKTQRYQKCPARFSGLTACIQQPAARLLVHPVLRRDGYGLRIPQLISSAGMRDPAAELCQSSGQGSLWSGEELPPPSAL